MEEAKANEQAAIEHEAQKKKEERDKFLISLGLVTEKNRKYSDVPVVPYVLYDSEVKKYYYDSPMPVEVTDEEFEEIKKYAQLNKKVDETEVEEELPYNNSAEKTLSTINTIMLAIALLGGFIWFFVALSNAGFMAGIPALGVMLGYLIVWATVKVYVNISNNLHEINHKLDNSKTKL